MVLGASLTATHDYLPSELAHFLHVAGLQNQHGRLVLKCEKAPCLRLILELVTKILDLDPESQCQEKPAGEFDHSSSIVWPRRRCHGELSRMGVFSFANSIVRPRSRCQATGHATPRIHVRKIGG
eukprot:gnl/MRDRNA2_/MRDRNA2_246075_c0_seq1.p1 gnl/MRDRNA2_/MRDRNA2_246075_c0~~gnl/MRDRNA2_/MRDRNA2_246075_c0_seq1.p1  ORF type:complete len:125 (+),score=18.69 gnl/MRDRNA2_/MRDRNA2_246075_c0_seq1:2-376(+)